MNNKIKFAMMTTAPMAAMLLAGTAHADEQYTVQSGDTLYKISQKFDVDMNTLAKENNIQNVNQIYVGEQLTIPTNSEKTTYSNKTVSTSTSTETPKTTQTTYTQSTNKAATNTNNAVNVTSANTTSYNTTSTASTTSSSSASTSSTSSSSSSSSSSSEEAAKAWIANKESGGSYTATNGRYIGKYQLDSSYLNGDYSAENQERVANNYVQQRYGSWTAAQAFWQANGWY